MFQVVFNTCYQILDSLFGQIFSVIVLPDFIITFIPKFIYYALILNMYFPIGLLITLAISCVMWHFTLMFVSASLQVL